MTLSVPSRMRGILAILVCLPAIFVTGGCERTGTIAQSGMEAGELGNSRTIVTEPAKTAETPLLLLDDGEGEAAEEPEADNSRCFVCHVNYMQEPVAANHARRGIGCARCHGDSDAHIADESWGSGGNGTAPDIMYPREKINSACMGCHPKEKIAAPQHETVFAKSDPKVCTDCHGDHRLAVRRCNWR